MRLQFIISSHNRVNNLNNVLACLQSQTNENWNCLVVVDGPNNSYDKCIEYFSSDNRIEFLFLEKQYKDFGNTPKNIGLQIAKEEFVVMTSDDNYYVPSFVNEILNNVNEEINFIYCDMIHNGYEYKFFETHHSSHRIDVGIMVMRTNLAKQLKLIENRIDSDGIFCHEYISKFCQNKNSIKKINKILYAHN
jgi:glycosyltransferase involved in cell wall biosynthesis